ncbi:vomeronasal type-2 receptor 1-like [Aulostomus maculatus]
MAVMSASHLQQEQDWEVSVTTEVEHYLETLQQCLPHQNKRWRKTVEPDYCGIDQDKAVSRLRLHPRQNSQEKAAVGAESFKLEKKEAAVATSTWLEQFHEGPGIHTKKSLEKALQQQQPPSHYRRTQYLHLTNRSICLFFLSPLSLCSASPPSSCQLWRRFQLNEIHKRGDVILGGLFEVHYTSVFSEQTFTSEPLQPRCQGFDMLGFRHAMTMAFAIDEINRNTKLLPNLTLGYSIYDNCGALVIGFSGALSLAGGREEQFHLQHNCSGTPPVLAIVGDSYSTFSIAESNLLGLYKMPMVSYFATCSCLSDRQRYPTFFRTIPSDAFQVRAMIQILKRFGWTWVGLLVSDDDYGLHVARSFQSDLSRSGGGCLAYLEVLPWDSDPHHLKRIVHVMKTSTARVVMLFAHEIHVLKLLEEVVRQNVTGLQWLASEAWTTAAVLQTPHFMPYLEGTLGIAIRRGEIPGLKEFLLRIRPKIHEEKKHRHSIVQQFWEHTFQCRFVPPPAGWLEAGGALCTGQEDLRKAETGILDVSNLRPEYNIYKAVYALAYALDDMLQCVPGRGPFSGSSCATLQRLEPWQLVHYLEKINFTTSFGDQVSFDENGDALPIYDVMNWLWLPDGRTKVQNVGEVKETVFKGGELTLDENKIFWNFQPKQPPRSVCSESCPPGTRMARKKGEPECCFDCIFCSDGKISNTTVGFAVLLGYIGLLAILSFLLAFLARNLPDNFNEAKFITFSMLIFCAVWVAFVPAYVNSPGKYADAVEVFAILASSFGLLKGRVKVMWTSLDSNLLSLMHFMLSFYFPSAVSSASSSTSCRLQGQFHLNGMHKAGDVVLGGLFEIHFFSAFQDLSFTSEQQQPTCNGFDVLGFRQAQSMVFTISEINRNSNLLPNVTLGYTLYDNCVTLGIGFRAALSLASGQEEQFTLEKTCEGAPPVLGIVGDDSSTRSIAISSVLGLYRVPMVSYFATCACLSNRDKFPSFFRTIPSDAFQVRALIQILNRFRWTWVGLLVSEDDYGLHAARSFQSDLAKSGEACLAYLEVLPWGKDPDELSRIVGVMKESTARVVIAFAHESDMINLLNEVMRQNVTGLQWLASEAWTTAAVLQTPRFMPYLGGTLGIAIRRGEIPGLKEFLLRIRPDKHHNISYGNNMVNQFWEHTFQCRFAPPPAGWLEAGGALCTGDEQLENVETEFLDVSNLRPEYNVYKAVYALAYALDDMLQCVPGRGPFSRSSCATLQRLEPWQLVYYLRKINFTTPFGDQVLFDDNGDVVPIYDVMNWLWLPDGRTKVQNVGEVKETVFKVEVLTLDEKKIFWNFQPKQPPRSVCSESCPPGTRMARKKGEPECCFDCIPCSDGKISNNTDSMECISCPDDFWSNSKRDNCVPKKTEFLSYREPLGICLTTSSLLGTLICSVVLGIFIYHRSTPIVRANNSELSFLLLVSLKLCFLCSLLFIGRPRLWTCQLRHAAFGISFVLCVSCILVKTMVVLAVFKASKPGGGASLKWFGALQQRGTVLGLTSIQAAICTTWLVSASPSPHKNTQYHNDKIVYECVVGSTVGFAVLLGYIGLLAILSFLLAFLARNLPDNFNEAKFITFSMLIFCAVWVAFVPAYVNSPGKYADAVEVFAILASSLGLLVALFGPKCYIILLRPERNTKKAIMGRRIAK